MKNSCWPVADPTSRKYCDTPVPPVHWNVTVDAVNVDEGAGVVICAFAGVPDDPFIAVYVESYPYQPPPINDDNRTKIVLPFVGRFETVALRLVPRSAPYTSEPPAVVPTCSRYWDTPVPPVHWKVTVDDVNVDEGGGVVICAGAVVLDDAV